MDSSHPDPARHASGGLTQTPLRDGGGKGDESERDCERASQRRENRLKEKDGEEPGEREVTKRRRDLGEEGGGSEE